MTNDNPALASQAAATQANEYRKAAARLVRCGADGMAAVLRADARKWLTTARYLKAMA